MASIRWSETCTRPSLSLSEQALNHYMHCTLNYKYMNILLDEHAMGTSSYLVRCWIEILCFTNPNKTV